MVGLGIYSTLVAKVYNRWGPRITVTIGAFVCTSAILATSQCNSIYLLLLTYGVIFGFGSCFIFLPSFLVIPRYFIKRRSLAVGIITMGVGGSLLVTSPIIKALLDALGWRKMFMVLAGFVALTIPLVFTIQTLPPEVAEEQLDDDTAEGFFEGVRSVVRNQRFAIIFLSMNLFYIVIYIPSVHMVSFFYYYRVLFFLEQSAFLIGSLSNHDDDGNKNPQICIFDNEKQYFFTLCTCIFSLMTF